MYLGRSFWPLCYLWLVPKDTGFALGLTSLGLFFRLPCQAPSYTDETLNFHDGGHKSNL